jgi:hypothetical protein
VVELSKAQVSLLLSAVSAPDWVLAFESEGWSPGAVGGLWFVAVVFVGVDGVVVLRGG